MTGPKGTTALNLSAIVSNRVILILAFNAPLTLAGINRAQLAAHAAS
jgi:hypothetical protein